MTIRDRVFEHSIAYRIFQAPFIKPKVAPLWRRNDMTQVRRVLDVGCGPGTNAQFFADGGYLGVDVNPDYIADARRRFPGKRFEIADVTHEPLVADDADR